ncbi:hypothetical protein AAG747_25940 [Rapidithrix thailandica]|uniref:Uncharacterized protein n=1 Tax=Rapidithrix thailandica TaxID=413964 RepID=A0AAW9S2G7_9BACT
MENSPELNGKYLGTISQDFLAVANTLKEAAYQLRVRKISDFPIFPISKEELHFGQLLIGKDEMALNWNYYFSFLDEFVQRTLIDKEKVAEFKAAYKDPDEFCCLFVVDDEFVNYVYIPYPED